MVKLNSNSLTWAKKSMLEVGDGDLFPKPFEFIIIDAQWNEILSVLLDYELTLGSNGYLENNERYHWVGGRKSIVPKDLYSYRLAYQLDPLDSIVLTSLIHQYGRRIENIRMNEQTVHSHRFGPRSSFLYNDSINWNTFWERSLEKVQAYSEACVITCDISDYYNQIYHHVLENELASARVPREVIRFITDLLQKLSGGVSRGVPVGPHSVHLLAEIALNPIDRHLDSSSWDFCRYVDDFHIICDSKEEAQYALQQLTSIIDTHGRLILNRSKTKFHTKAEFESIASNKISDSPLITEEKKVIDIIQRHSSGDPYKTLNYRTLSAQELQAFTEEKLIKIFDEHLKKADPEFTRIRWLIRRLAQIGAPEAVNYLIVNLAKFTPAIGEISNFFKSAESNYPNNWIDVGEKFIEALDLKLTRDSTYIKMTIINLFSKSPNLNHINELLKKYKDENNIIKRKILLSAIKSNHSYWIKERKSEFSSSDPWLKRAIILGASTFESDEQKHWLNSIIFDPSNKKLEIEIAKWVKRGGTI